MEDSFQWTRVTASKGVCHLMVVVVVVVERLLTLYALLGSYDDGEISFVIS